MKKGLYVNLEVINYYEDIDTDWEDDDWVIQYQDKPGYEGLPEELPILRYSKYSFENTQRTFGKNFEPLLKEWFEKTYKLKVKTMEKI
jgi:hypothetical protein